MGNVILRETQTYEAVMKAMASGRHVLEICWLLVALLVPLAVNLWARQPFEPPKAALLRSLVWVMAGLWLVDAMLRPQGYRRLWTGLRRNPLLWPVLAVAATQVLSTALAVDPRLSLWGSYERAQGALTTLSYLLLFLVISSRLRTVEQARRLVGAMACSGVPLVVLGLAQALGQDPLGLVSDARSPIYATLGRSNFVGAYLAMLLPLTLALVLTARVRWQRLAAAALALCEVMVIALTMARGAWLAATAALALFGLFWFWPRLPRPARWTAVLGGLAMLGAGLVGALWLGGEGGSTAARLTIWQATLDLVVERPLLGYGLDALELVFPRLHPPQLVYYHGRGVTVDRAHNLLLDWALTTGIMGLVAILALLVTFFVAGWRAVQRASDRTRRALLCACLAAVAGNLAGNMVSFDVTATATATWLLLALLPALGEGARGDKKRLSIPSQSLSPRWSRNWLRWAGAGFLSLAVAIAIVQVNVRPQAADVAGRTGDRRSAMDDWPGAIKVRERAIVLWPAEPAHRLSLSWSYLQRAQAGAGDPLPWLQGAEAQLLAARELRPEDFRIWAALGELYGAWGNRWDASRLPLAHNAYRQATILAPNHATLFTGWGLVYLESQDFAGASARFRQAVDLDATDGFAFAHLGHTELVQGYVEAALAAYRQAVRWEPGLSSAHLGLARCYWSLGQRGAAELALAQALQLDPGNAAARALRREIESEP